VRLDGSRGASSHLDMDDMTPADLADMRIEIVKRELHQGALAGMDIEVSDYAARLVIAALDTFDAEVQQRAYAQGFLQGVAFQKQRSEGERRIG
jgi:hypothetical protein